MEETQDVGLFADGSVGILGGSAEWGWGWLTKGGCCGMILASSDLVLRFFHDGLSVMNVVMRVVKSVSSESIRSSVPN